MNEEDQKLPNETLDSEQGPKIALEERSSERAHSTEHAEEEPITDINVTPLVDVALVLVIIFMAVSPFMLQAGLVVSESRAGAATGKASIEKNVQITLSQKGTITVDGQIVLLNDLNKILKIKIPKSKDWLVTVQAEKENRVGDVVDILDVAKQCGARNVAIINKYGESLEPIVGVPPPAAATPTLKKMKMKRRKRR